MKGTGTLYLLLAAILFGPFATAQQNESDERVNLNPQRGVRYVAKDSSFSLLFRFRLQNQALAETRGADDFSISRTEARIRRMRLRVEGFIANPRLTYYLQLSFSRADLDISTERTPNITRDAMIFYQIAPWWTMGFGQAKLPGNRERVVSSGNLQFAERSIANGRFTLDRDFGYFNYFRVGERRPFIIKTAISSGEGRNALNGDRGLCYTGRMEWLVLNNFENEGDYSEGDVDRHEHAALSIGGTYSFNHMARRVGGQLGPNLYHAADISSAFLDMMFKYRGIGVLGELFYRDSPLGPQYKAGDPVLYVYSGRGLNLQASKMISLQNEIAFRYTRVDPHKKIGSFENRQDVLSLGLTRYLAGHRVKVQFNLNYQTRGGDIRFSNPRNNWAGIFQMELGI